MATKSGGCLSRRAFCGKASPIQRGSLRVVHPPRPTGQRCSPVPASILHNDLDRLGDVYRISDAETRMICLYEAPTCGGGFFCIGSRFQRVHRMPVREDLRTARRRTLPTAGGNPTSLSPGVCGAQAVGFPLPLLKLPNVRGYAEDFRRRYPQLIPRDRLASEIDEQ